MAAESSLKAFHLGRPRLGADRVLVVDAKTIDPGPRAVHRLATIYAQNPDLVRPPRSFDADRLRQPLRWLSTLLQQQFPLGTEIQCYYEPQRRSIIVLSNVNRINGSAPAVKFIEVPCGCPRRRRSAWTPRTWSLRECHLAVALRRHLPPPHERPQASATLR